jgi:hypothetical protein
VARPTGYWTGSGETKSAGVFLNNLHLFIHCSEGKPKRNEMKRSKVSHRGICPLRLSNCRFRHYPTICPTNQPSQFTTAFVACVMKMKSRIKWSKSKNR